MSFSRPTLSEIIERARGDIASRLPGADAQLRHSVLDVLARMHSGAAASLYGYLDYLALQLMPDTAEGAYLNRWSSIWGIRRKAATQATANAIATGNAGASIAKGVQALRIDGAAYEVIADAAIAGGTATLQIRAVDAGPATSLTDGTELTFVQPVAGVNAAITVDGPGVPGVDEESDEALLARLLARIRQQPKGGAAHDYVAWALAQPGVTRAWAWAGWMGAGTVGLSFVMDDREDILPLPADIEAVQAAIDAVRPVTAELYVFAPAAEPVDFVLRITPDNAATRAAIVAELADLFTREAEPGGTIYLSRIGEAISLAEGEFQHRIEVPAADYTAAVGAMPMLGEVTFL
ncbi:MAG: baseplate J/gp47 family protein [Sphingomonadales bacterium]|nr:baseplate J/gp47 family protein [Sphingomonadales bacterium]MBD3772132.1 baseplate J/gp47 family protein [Paracoccaceae bacterium]